MADATGIDELVRRAQTGDVRAFEQLVDRHLAQVRRFARAFVRNEHDADDLAQEALVKVYRSIRQFRFQASFSTWLFTVTRNCFLDAAKTARGRARTAEAGAAETDGPEVEPPDQALERAQERRAVWAAIARVPADFRTALVLCDVEGLSYEEVAAIERVPIGTVRSRLSRAREHLRRLLGEPVGPGESNEGRAIAPAAERTSAP